MINRLFNGMVYNLLGMFDNVLGFIVHDSCFPFFAIFFFFVLSP